MPMRFHRTLTGAVDWNGYCYILKAEDGDWCCVDMDGGPEPLVGHKVTVEGLQLGINWFYVSRVLAVDGVERKSGFIATLLGRFKTNASY